MGQRVRDRGLLQGTAGRRLGAGGTRLGTAGDDRGRLRRARVEG